jgi:ATP/maltotriose-dependent transcriptional regulator MalT
LSVSVPRPVMRGALLVALDSPAWLTTVVAGAGAGKSTLLSTWATGRPAAYRELRAEDAALTVLLRGLADAFDGVGVRLAPAVTDALRDPTGVDDETRAVGVASLVAAALDQPATVPAQAARAQAAALVLDGLQNLPATGPSMRFVEALCRHTPRALRLVLASRHPLPFRVDRLRAAGLLRALDVEDLTFAEDETYQALAAALGDAAAADALAPDLHLLTSGWPALVALAASWLARQPQAERPSRLAQLGQAVGPLAEYLVTTLLAAQLPADREIVRYAAHLPAVDSALCDALDLAEHVTAKPPFLEAVPMRPGWFAVPRGQRDIVLARLPLGVPERKELLRKAVAAYARRGLIDEAFATARCMGESETMAALLAEHGPALIAAGRAADVVAEASKVPADARTQKLDLAEGEARHICGDLNGALACFERLAAGDGEIPAALAHRIGNLYHSAGNLEAALDAYERGSVGDESSADEAILLARRSGIHWLRGDTDRCRDLARRALKAAERSADDHARAAAHNAAAAAAERDGDWAANAEQLDAAFAAATRAGDLMSQLRTLVGRSQRTLEQSRYADALAALDESMRLVEATGSGERRAMVMINRGWAYRGLGRLDEAVSELEAARVVWHEAGSALEAYAQIGLGAVYLVRGDLAAADAVLSAATASAERTGDSQSWAALATLCRVRYATDPEGAQALAGQALATHTGLWRVWALLSAGWIALHRGEVAQAARFADEAAEVIERRRDLTALAESHELRAFIETDPTLRLRLLRTAQTQYTRIGNGLFVVRTLAAQSVVAGDTAAAAAAEGRLRALGVRPEAALAAGPLRAMGAFSRVFGVSPAPVTLQAFRATVRAGLDRFARGDLAAAASLLSDAVERCPGETDGHTGCVDAMRALAAAAFAQDSADTALRWFLRVLEHSPDDEIGHLGAVTALVRGGRTGEAHGRYRIYAERMRSSGVEPAPFPA